MEKILKHIKKEESFNKCFNLLKSFLIKTENIPEIVILNIFLNLMDLDFRCKDLNLKKIEGNLNFYYFIIRNIWLFI